MGNSETATELLRLRNELEVLQQANASTETGDQALPRSAASVAASTWSSEDIDQRMKDIARLVRAEARERPLVTLLVVFALGLLLGRLIR